LKINKRYIIFVVVLIGIYVVFQLLMPRQFNWSPTFHHYDKNPYGAFVLNEIFEERFDTVVYSYRTLYEMKDEPDANILIIANYFNLDEEDLETLLNKVDSGSYVIVAAEYFDYKLQDTLGFVSDWLPDLYNLQSELDPTETDSIFFQIVQADVDSQVKYNFPWQIGQIEFREYDSLKASVFAINERDNPVVVRHRIGNGELVLCSTPLIFTNYSILLDNNYQLAEQIFSLMDDSSLKWIHYYHLGRMESPSPLRYVLGQVPLKWAFYLTMATIFLSPSAPRRA